LGYKLPYVVQAVTFIYHYLITVSWDVTQCSLVDKASEEPTTTVCPHHRTEDVGRQFFCNVGAYLHSTTHEAVTASARTSNYTQRESLCRRKLIPTENLF
jgi:hypothetical protein